MRLFSILFLLAAAAPIHAQTKDPCTTLNNTYEIDACAKIGLAIEDKKLNVAFQKLLKSFVSAGKGDDTDYDGSKKLLIEAQKNWIKFRDADCKGQLLLNLNGTSRGVIYLGCLTDRTEQRTKELTKWADG
jgi:uncharacterized protein YecT (DUF1311 family)